MPELPRITVYLAALVPGRGLEAIRLAGSFLFRSADPGPPEAEGR